ERKASATDEAPSATTRRSTTVQPAAAKASERAAPDLSSRVPATTPSETVRTLAAGTGRPRASGRRHRRGGQIVKLAGGAAGIGRMEHGAARHEHLGTRFGRRTDRERVD